MIDLSGLHSEIELFPPVNLDVGDGQTYYFLD